MIFIAQNDVNWHDIAKVIYSLNIEGKSNIFKSK